MSGVPAEEVTADDFMMVRAALVRRLGGANEALVWARVFFRCNPKSQPYVDSDGTAWWRASYEQVGEETGLSGDQVKRAFTALEASEFIVSTEHRVGGNYDRTKSYRPVVSGRLLDQAKSPDGAGGIANRSGRNRQQDQADSPNVPSSKNKVEEARKTRAVALPQQFVITDELRAWARTEVPLVDVDAKLGEWMDYWRGRGTPMKDWVAVWRNGMRKQQQFAVRDAARLGPVDADAWMRA